MRCLALGLLVGCVHSAPRQVAEAPTPVRVVTALGSYESEVVEALPDDVVERVGEELERRRLVAEPVGVFAEAFGVRRSPEARLEVLEEAGVAAPLLLIGCDPRFDTQVNGRFRWQVSCDVVLSAAEGEGATVHGSIQAAAHPVYYHQQEAVAVQEVSALLAREVGRVLDEWLSTR